MEKDIYTIGVKYIPTILDRSVCQKHRAPHGVPCWVLVLDGGKEVSAVCNKRVKRAGFNAGPNLLPKTDRKANTRRKDGVNHRV